MLILPPRQEEVWVLYLKGHSQVEISSRLNITKQATGAYLKQVRAKILEILLSLARAIDINISKLYSEKGILIGFS